MPKTLSVYEFGPDWVVAYSPYDALMVIEEQYGVGLKEFAEPEDIEAGATLMADDRILRLIFDTWDVSGPEKRFNTPPDATMEAYNNQVVYIAAASQWAAVWGRGFLASEEY